MYAQGRGKAAKPGPVHEVQPPGINQILLFKVALVVLAVLGVGTFTTALLIRPEVVVLGEGPKGARAEKELTEILGRLRSTWDPEARARILKEAWQHDARFVGALRRILGQWNHPLRLQAVEYAGAFGAPELRPDVAGLAARGRANIRAAAIRAAERLGPWSNPDLAELLATRIVEVQVAVLQIVTERQDGPWREAIALLASEDPEVREAALAAIPRRPPEKAVQELWNLIQAGPAGATALGLLALGRTDRAGDFEADVTELMSRAEPRVQLAALECLAQKGAALAHPEAVRELAWDFARDFEVRCQAFRCLEHTGSYDLEETRSGAFALEPRLQYFAARCLVAGGDTAGLTLLMDLADAEDAAVALASRRLLARLTGLSPKAPVTDFRNRVDRGVECAGPLPAPSVSF